MLGVPMTRADAELRVDRLLALLERSANADYIGEGVSQLTHALQAAALARGARASDAAVAAALLHDVGHLCAEPTAPQMSGVGVMWHEEIGADHLAALGFSDAVTRLVRGHVAAKRFLVSRDPGYLERLSDASRVTLRHQGGPMGDDERRAFESLSYHEDLLRLRSWDERAKDPTLRVPGLSTYRDLLLDQLAAR
jgi:predicted HD phosphohydrolase